MICEVEPTIDHQQNVETESKTTAQMVKLLNVLKQAPMLYQELGSYILSPIQIKIHQYYMKR